MAVTAWNEIDPPELPPLTLTQKLRGAFRVVVFVTMTLIALGLFLVGRALRHWLGRWVTFHFGVARFWSRGGLALLGLRHRAVGAPVASGALVANHCSWLDILTIRAVRLVYFVSKADVADWPGVGFVTKVAGTVFIERRRTEAKRQEQVLLERIAAEQLLCFFPEATSTDGARVLEFKSSLFSAFFHDGHGEDFAVQPVTVRYHAPEGLPDVFYGWWGTMGFEAHIWQVACRSSGGVAEVIFHAPVRPKDYVDRKSMAQSCRDRVAKGHETGQVVDARRV